MRKAIHSQLVKLCFYLICTSWLSHILWITEHCFSPKSQPDPQHEARRQLEAHNAEPKAHFLALSQLACIYIVYHALAYSFKTVIQASRLESVKPMPAGESTLPKGVERVQTDYRPGRCELVAEVEELTSVT